MVSKQDPQVLGKPRLTRNKLMLCVRWDWKGIIHYELLPPDKIVNPDLYCQQLMKLKQKSGREIDASQAKRLGHLSIACSALSLARSAQAQRDNESYFFVPVAGVHRFIRQIKMKIYLYISPYQLEAVAFRYRLALRRSVCAGRRRWRPSSGSPKFLLTAFVAVPGCLRFTTNRIYNRDEALMPLLPVTKRGILKPPPPYVVWCAKGLSNSSGGRSIKLSAPQPLDQPFWRCLAELSPPKLGDELWRKLRVLNGATLPVCKKHRYKQIGPAALGCFDRCSAPPDTGPVNNLGIVLGEHLDIVKGRLKPAPASRRINGRKLRRLRSFGEIVQIIFRPI
ncbi:hypothetical protein EVAR_2254_1 [Eumeta japonica]|uniref:Mariner Mos1 transposase n=1 Tax=Eumeta variegata TaxID=151549 RepID=A0A4C1SFS7_EUMVA|nr:hypothetical protein EVAR_2254_1 [Eumeta japonica]